jgi:signal transduction histidine kinase
VAAASNIAEFPVHHDEHGCPTLEHEVVLALATADDLASAMARIVELVHRSSAATSVEWWSTGDNGTPNLGAAIGIARGTRHDLPLAGIGVLVLHGGNVEPEIASAMLTAAPVMRRRAAEERLAQTAINLARRNRALEDFAALVAHELKTPLHAALLADDPSPHVDDALERVDALLEAAQTESGERVFVAPAESLERAVEDVGAGLEVTTDLQAEVPLPPGALRVILRNLLSNAVAAGARRVHVSAVQSSHSLQLFVDDDGVGLADTSPYAAGSGLGLSLSRRVAGRFGGVLDLAPNPCGGTRAMLEFNEAPQ